MSWAYFRKRWIAATKLFICFHEDKSAVIVSPMLATPQFQSRNQKIWYTGVQTSGLGLGVRPIAVRVPPCYLPAGCLASRPQLSPYGITVANPHRLRSCSPHPRPTRACISPLHCHCTVRILFLHPQFKSSEYYCSALCQYYCSALCRMVFVVLASSISLLKVMHDPHFKLKICFCVVSVTCLPSGNFGSPVSHFWGKQKPKAILKMPKVIKL